MPGSQQGAAPQWFIPSYRQKQLEDILVLAKQFHETTEPVSDWLSVTEKKLANSEPIGTQTAKIQQQIGRHKVGPGHPQELLLELLAVRSHSGGCFCHGEGVVGGALQAAWRVEEAAGEAKR